MVKTKMIEIFDLLKMTQGLNEIKHDVPIVENKASNSQKGLPEGWTRATFIVKKDYVEKLKEISYWERVTIKDLINDALTNYLNNRDFSSYKK